MHLNTAHFRTIFFLLPVFWVLVLIVTIKPNAQARPTQAKPDTARQTTVNHGKVAALQQVFATGEHITAACISCHSEASDQFKKTLHWTWIAPSKNPDRPHGKAGYILNNYCLSGNAMEDIGCVKCHTSWDRAGTKGEVNCLKCHNSSGFNFDEAFADIKAMSEDDDPESAEFVAEIQEEIKAAVGKITLPTRKHCGDCHFWGGGGDGVKHGDLDSSLYNPDKKLDVHMAADGANFTCTRCHTTSAHNIAGRVYTKAAFDERKTLLEDDLASKITCVSCHGYNPHKTNARLNDHGDVVACQTCHIPRFARVNPTKMSWNWETAGKFKHGKPYEEKDEFGKPAYKTIKGTFTWDKNVVPEYFWYNGEFSLVTIDDAIDPNTVVQVNHPVGTKKDPKARIAPFKVHKGRQPYDAEHNKLLAPLLSGTTGYWRTFDMDDAIRRGQNIMNLEYSGKIGYVDTTYALPISHMVAPKEDALTCVDCHVRAGSRLAGVTDVYLPARDKSGLLETLGWLAAGLALIAVLIHGLWRVLTIKKRRAK